MSLNITLNMLRFFCVLSEEKKEKVYAQYYDEALKNDTKLQAQLESQILKNLPSNESNCIIVENNMIIYEKVPNELVFVLGAGPKENEIFLYQALTSFIDAFSDFVKKELSLKTLEDNLDVFLIFLDEFVESGTILEPVGTEIFKRSEGKVRPNALNDVLSIGNLSEINPSDITLSKVISTAKDHIRKLNQ